VQCQINSIKKKEKTSQYKGVSWDRAHKTWQVKLWLKEGKCKFGGNFKDELNAAKRVNQVCKELGIPLQNPDISAAPENVLDYGPIKAELQRLIKFLDEKK